MTDQSDLELEQYKAQLRRQEMNWRARFDSMESSDRAAVDIGLVAVRTAVLINAGAAVALLAFVGQLWRDQNPTLKIVLHAMQPFVWGLLAAAVAAGVAYFYQSFMTARYQHGLAEISEAADKLQPMKFTPWFAGTTGILMIALVIASYVFFAWGTLFSIRALAP